jgi:hypothetical protein
MQNSELRSPPFLWSEGFNSSEIYRRLLGGGFAIQRKFFCSTITRFHIPQLLPLKQSDSGNLEFYPHVTKSESPTNCHMFGQLKKHCGDGDRPMMMNLRPQSRIFFADEIRRLANSYIKCVGKKELTIFINVTFCISHSLLYTKYLVI